ncbi:hypothetical protein FB446DRAFT_204926 [Lentinula raphanica]|nr:hypothetical protein FB446DRAFT_204926 [Lentinula raphanica]
MKATFLALSFVSLPSFFSIVAAQSSLSLWLPLPSDDGSGVTDSISIASPTAWVDPIGTASDGSETTFVYNEVDSGDAAIFGDVQTGTTVVTTSFTLVASASGFRVPDVASASVECILESSDTGGCIYIAQADADGTSLVTVTETGFPVSFYEVPISAATSESGSGSPTSTGSPPETTGAQNAGLLNQPVNLYLLGFIGVGLLVGVW